MITAVDTNVLVDILEPDPRNQRSFCDMASAAVG